MSLVFELNSDVQSSLSVTPRSGPVMRERSKFMSFGCVNFESHIKDVHFFESMQNRRLVQCTKFETNSSDVE